MIEQVAAAPAPSPTVRNLLRLVSTLTGLELAQIVSDKRDPVLCRARWAVMWAAHRGLGYSLVRIGDAMRWRDHSTVIHGIRRAETLRAADVHFRQLTDRLLASTQSREIVQ